MERKNTSRKRIRPLEDLDDLRLFALGRIPRCVGCARLGALKAAHARGGVTAPPLPPPPPTCHHRVCAPIAERLVQIEPTLARPRSPWSLASGE